MSLPAAVGYRRIAEGLDALETGLPFELATADAAIFDVDGVLVEVSGSFRQVISVTVQFYFNEVLGVPGSVRFITGEETGLFKLAGRYNNDWELSDGAVAFGLLKLLEAESENGVTVDALRLAAPPLEEFTGAVKARGGGLDNTLNLVRERLEPAVRDRFDQLYQPEQIKRIFMEYYAGSPHCRRLYGFDPEYYSGPGLIENEIFLLDLGLAERLGETGVRFAILSGRTPGEADFLIRNSGLDRFLDPHFVITDDGSFPGKPDPSGLRLLAERMNFQAAVYVGDVPDDWTTVVNYQASRGSLSPVAGCLVRTGATAQKLMQEFYDRAGVHYVAADVNSLLAAWLTGRGGS